MRIVPTGSESLVSELPGPVYCDTSALVKLYLPESESDVLNELVRGRRDLMASDLAVTEIVSSLCRRQREGSLDSEALARLHRTILSHLQKGVFQRLELVPETHREAERLLVSLKHLPLRSADALHLALALQGQAMSVLTYDHRLAEAARQSGLGVHP